ncbi:hypothetical protein FACS1894172_16250 [Spirochaetia bacterium]|nr:hypothetical protein FACS1894172_16250 [Spirochaetia bacterium]
MQPCGNIYCRIEPTIALRERAFFQLPDYSIENMVIKIMAEISVKLCHAEWNKSLYDFVYINVQKD